MGLEPPYGIQIKLVYQLSVHVEVVPKKTVIIPIGFFEFLLMPFGLKGAAQTIQRLMDSVLHELLFIFVDLVDILVASTLTPSGAP